MALTPLDHAARGADVERVKNPEFLSRNSGLSALHWGTLLLEACCHQLAADVAVTLLAVLALCLLCCDSGRVVG